MKHVRLNQIRDNFEISNNTVLKAFLSLIDNFVVMNWIGTPYVFK